MRIQKVTLTVTILRNLDESADPIESYSLEDIASNIEDGPWLGAMKVEGQRTLLPEEVVEECKALGNDGAFFGEASIFGPAPDWDEFVASCNHMQPVIEHGDYFEVETSNGTEYVPADVVGSLGFKVIHAAGGFYDAEYALWSQIVAALSPYVEGFSIERVEPRRGWLARMSAPGYMDCTAWTAHETEEDARAYLIDNYGND